MLNAVAILILAGMMFLPFINLLVGVIAGGATFGFSGAFAGATVAILITAAQKKVIDHRSARPAQMEFNAKTVEFPEGAVA